MALTAKFIDADDTVFESAYYFINNVTIQRVDYEKYEDNGNDIVMSYVSRPTVKLSAYIYADSLARKHRVVPINIVDWEFDPKYNEPLLTEAYKALKTLINGEDC